MQYLSEYGLWGLGISAFLAATLLPLSSELVLASLLLAGESPTLLIIIATIANVLGSLVNYVIGRWGADSILYHWFKLSPKQIKTSTARFNRYGSWSLLFSWVPIFGDPLTFLAGLLKVRLSLFILLVFIGKLARYILLCQALLLSQPS